MRLSETKRQKNRSSKSQIKNLIKRVREAKTKEEAHAAYKQVTATLDKLAVKKVIHKNNAANKKSRLSKVVASLEK